MVRWSFASAVAVLLLGLGIESSELPKSVAGDRAWNIPF